MGLIMLTLSFGMLLPFKVLALSAISLLDFTVASQRPPEVQAEYSSTARLHAGSKHKPQKVSDSSPQEAALGAGQSRVSVSQREQRCV